MIQRYTRLIVADNTGAKEAMCIHIPGASKIRTATLGQIITVVVKKADPHGMVKNAEMTPAVVARVKKEIRRSDGSYIRFDDNAVILINKDKTPKGTRVFGPVAKELKDHGFLKITSLAKEVI